MYFFIFCRFHTGDEFKQAASYPIYIVTLIILAVRIRFYVRHVQNTRCFMVKIYSICVRSIFLNKRETTWNECLRYTFGLLFSWELKVNWNPV